MGRNTVAIRIAAPLEYLLITVKVVALEKVSFSDTQNPKTFCYHSERQFNATNSDAIILKRKKFFSTFFLHLSSLY